MTEQEYIDATNLAKIRCALAVLREFVGSEEKLEAKISEATKKLYEVHDYLCSIVSTSE